MDVHARDVVAQLASEGIEGQPQHFSWLSQLRMYWEDAPAGADGGGGGKSLFVRMINAQVSGLLLVAAAQCAVCMPASGCG